MWILLSQSPLPGYQRAGNCRSRESLSSLQADLFVTICEAFDSLLFACYGCDAWFEGSLPLFLIKEKASWSVGEIADPQYHTASGEHTVGFVNLFHPCYPSALQHQPSTPSLTRSLRLSSTVTFSGWLVRPHYMLAIWGLISGGSSPTDSASWRSLMNWLMFHYIQSQLSMSKDISVQWNNNHGVHVDRTCRYTNHCLMGSGSDRKCSTTTNLWNWEFSELRHLFVLTNRAWWYLYFTWVFPFHASLYVLLHYISEIDILHLTPLHLSDS